MLRLFAFLFSHNGKHYFASPLSMMLKGAFDLCAKATIIRKVVYLSLAEWIVNQGLAGTNKAYKTTEVGDWLATNI